jgi:hypothetical protein
MRGLRMLVPVALLTALVAWSGTEVDGPDFCDDVQGDVEARFIEGSAMVDESDRPADIEGKLSGDVQAAAYAWIDALDPADGLERQPAEPVQVRMRHHYVGEGFTVWTADKGVLTPVQPPLYEFVNQLEVTSATGALAGGSGSFEARGTVDFGTGQIRLKYSGRICG